MRKKKTAFKPLCGIHTEHHIARNAGFQKALGALKVQRTKIAICPCGTHMPEPLVGHQGSQGRPGGALDGINSLGFPLNEPLNFLPAAIQKKCHAEPDGSFGGTCGTAVRCFRSPTVARDKSIEYIYIYIYISASSSSNQSIFVKLM